MPDVPELASERARATFDCEAMNAVLAGGAARLQRKREVRAVLESEETFSNAENPFLTRTARHVRALAKAKRLPEVAREQRWSSSDFHLARRLLRDILPDDVHHSMFVPHCSVMMSDDQLAEWLPRMRSGEVIGCYAQTELAHGSNVRALRTTATYLPASDEFEIHTPDIEAAKWWPGGLGLTANHAMVFCRLLLPKSVDGDDDATAAAAGGYLDHGIHQFLVPIRDARHRLFAGVSTGDIGPKIGYNTMDNGYASFDHVRIPRANMPSRFVRVSREGHFSRNPEANPRIGYVTMLGVRALLIGSAGETLGHACTIAVRYSAVRRQGFKEGTDAETATGGAASGAAEHQVLDYTMQQYRLLPLLASAYVMRWAGLQMDADYAALSAGIAKDEMGSLPELHASSSGLKALMTRLTADGMEECRKACGGHGYLVASGLPEYSLSYLANCTLEGDNYMIGQQTTRFLLKQLHRAREGDAKQLPPSCAYLAKAKELATSSRCDASQPGDFLEIGVQLRAYEHRAACVLLQTEQAIGEWMAQGLSAADAQNAAMVEVNRASRAHCMLLLLRSCRQSPIVDELVAAQGSAATALRDPLDRLHSLFALWHMEQEMGDFLEGGFLSGEQAQMVRSQVRDLLFTLRPNAVALVDSWGLSDWELNSALGRRDGRVYEALFAQAQREPLNRLQPRGGWRSLLAGRSRL